jgi:hypothetical protein
MTQDYRDARTAGASRLAAAYIAGIGVLMRRLARHLGRGVACSVDRQPVQALWICHNTKSV